MRAAGRCSVGLVAAGLVALAATGFAADASSWRVVRGDVRVDCPLTVGGSFEARTASLAGELTFGSARPAVFKGGLSVDLATLDTGIGLRNEHMLSKYLEVGRGAGFDHAVLSEIQLDVTDLEAFQGRTTFAGTFLLHGTTRRITGQVEIRREGNAVRVEATFPVSVADFGIPKPQYLGVGVKNEVRVRVSLAAEPLGPGEPTR
jgi:polyisoprenoid-binding protein YceI